MDKELDYQLDEKGCWIFAGCKDRQGYGIIKYQGKNYKAHRYMFLKHKGQIPEGLLIRHRCNTTSCINPNHLLLGTQAQNMQDKIESKKRFCAGGHELTHENSYRYNSRTICKICKARLAARSVAGREGDRMRFNLVRRTDSSQEWEVVESGLSHEQANSRILELTKSAGLDGFTYDLLPVS